MNSKQRRNLNVKSKREGPQILYKTDKKVTLRKPRGKNSIPFVVSSPETISAIKMRNFVKYVITNVKDLNFLKNDLGFLMNELYGDDHSCHEKIAVDAGRIFFVWVYFPYEEEKGSPSNSGLPKDIQEQIFPYDVFYIRRHLTDSECNAIIAFLRKNIDVSVHVRQVNEKVHLPFTVKIGVTVPPKKRLK